MAVRTSYDISPLFRSSIGFDRIFDLLQNTARVRAIDNWPPYDIEKTGDDRYRITLAVAGFSPDEISVTLEPNQLVVSGTKSGDEGGQHLHHGIAARSFVRRFELADYVKVASAKRRTKEGGQREPRQRVADHRARPRAARGDEAAPDRNPGRFAEARRAAAADRAGEAGGLIPASPASTSGTGEPRRCRREACT
jgi:molecular chaperone IbpA